MDTQENVSAFPTFGDAHCAFFNQRASDAIAGEIAVIEKFGEAALVGVKNNMRTGAMEIFQHPQTPAAAAYVMAVAESRELSANAEAHRQARTNENHDE